MKIRWVKALIYDWIIKGEGVKKLYVPNPRTLCRLSIGSLNISQLRRKYYHSQVATKEQNQFTS